MYDKDDSGTIELAEMTDIIGTLYDMEGVTSSGGEGNISKPTSFIFDQRKLKFVNIRWSKRLYFQYFSTSKQNIFRIGYQWRRRTHM